MNETDIKKMIEELLKSMGIRFDLVEIKEEPITLKKIYVIRTPDSGLLIGEEGETFYALSHLIRKISTKGVEEKADFSIDVNNYRESIIENLKIKAKILANRARDMKANIEMDPMSSYERLIVHGILTDEPSVKTESTGEGRERRIIIKYTGQ
ncbi:MAG: R3H domain-containing nucleic acid-binding protein [Candidatus Paceibacterota bacterium]|jgi:spoIIIJ-associated protein